MMSAGSLMQDYAVAGAAALLDVVDPALRPEEQREFFKEALRICLAMLEAYSHQTQREEARLLRPSRN
jgi:hypothetical protein